MTNLKKILLLGGTSETAPLALKLASVDYRVLVSTATDATLKIGDHPAITRRCGRLNAEQLETFINDQQIDAIVDATHPYAGEVHQVARQVAADSQRPYLRYQRQGLLTNEPGWIAASDHAEAAQIACEVGKPVLLTTGSRHLAPYVAGAKQCQVPLYARVLNHPESIAACDAAGLDNVGRIFGRGPFNLEQNRALIRQHQIGVVVTKDSGNAGGILEKLKAAQLESCLLIVIQRPMEPADNCFDDMDKLVAVLIQQCPV